MVVHKTGFLQHGAAGDILIGMAGRQPQPAHGAEPVIPHGAQSLGRVALVPPFAADGIADLPGVAQALGVQVPAGFQVAAGEQADGAKQHAAVFVLDAPLVKVRFGVVFFPLVQQFGRRDPAAVGVPAHKMRDLRVAGPVVVHHLAVVDAQPPQQQAVGVQFLGAAMFHGIVLTSAKGNAAQSPAPAAKAAAAGRGTACSR